MKKKVAIIGKGTAGSQSVCHFLKYMPDCEIEWHFDPNIPVQSVGEGATLVLPRNLYKTLNFNYIDMKKIDSAVKLGIYKSGWGNNKEDYLHQFPPPEASIHFSATSLQDYVFEKVKDKVKILEHNVESNNVDADYILDCSGKPESYEDFEQSTIPVNSAHVVNCYWEYPKFNYSLHIARPYGWVFGIALQNRCSIGYLYNRNINNLKEIKDDIKNVFKEYDLTPSDNVKNINFENYYRKNNYTDRVCYNGNSSFFLEPMEATSITTMDQIQRHCFDIWNNVMSVEDGNLAYKKFLKQIETMIMMHYFAGSNYDTEFWKFAKERGEECMIDALRNDNEFKSIIEFALRVKDSNMCPKENLNIADNVQDYFQYEYGTWWSGSFCENIFGLGIEKKLKDIIQLTNFL
jgi:hypothetical protein|tara:strand:+ start:2246 stop:3460 length:1215 start_codon:yes stop_codon:yes gene_type:complete